MKPKKFNILLSYISDAMSNLFYYDRKEDDNLTNEDCEESLTPEQIELFLAEVRKHL